MSLWEDVISSLLPYFRHGGAEQASRQGSHSTSFHGDSWLGCQAFKSFQTGW